MPTENIQVIRLEVSQETSAGSTNKSSASISPGTLVATAGVKGSLDKIIGTEEERTRKGDEKLKEIYPEKKMTPEQVKKNKELEEMFGYKPAPRPDWTEPKQAPIASKITPITKKKFDSKSAMKMGKKGVAAVSAAYAMYSQHQSIGYSLSGASHAAERQQRAASGATFATGLALSAATGQYWATALMLAGKAWQLAQTNRQEVFKIRSSVIISSVMKERLVKNTIERRF